MIYLLVSSVLARVQFSMENRCTGVRQWAGCPCRPTSLWRFHVAVLRLCMAASWAHSVHSGGGGGGGWAPLRFAAFLLVSLLFRLFHFGRRRQEVADFKDFPSGSRWHRGGGRVACLGRAETPFRWAPITLLPVVFFPCAHLSVHFPVLQALFLHPDLLSGWWVNVTGRLRSALRWPFRYQRFRGICFAVCCEMHGLHGLSHLGSFYFLRSDVTGAWEAARGGA